MATNLVIVESPSKAKTIEKYLGKNYEVIASVGHLRDLPEKTFGVNIENNFEPKYQIMPTKKELVKKLQKKAKEADNVYLATDPDREGEAISWHISKILKMDEGEKCRVTFNEITKNAVLNGMKNPRAIDLSLVDAQQARRVLDRIVGYKLSPLLWKKIRKGLSAGRVQSVAVKMICDREDEINNFKPKEYWTLELTFKTGKGSEFVAKFYGIGGKKKEIKNEAEMNAVVSDIKNAEFFVSDMKKTEKKKYPVPPFTTSTLQQSASRSLNFSSKKTMVVAQGLYEGVDIAGMGATGLITYMRTDSLRIADEARDSAKEYIINNIGAEYYPDKPNVFKKKSDNAQDAHEAIRPTHVELTPDEIKSSLTNDQYKLYKLIWNRFVSSQIKPALYDILTIEIEGKGEKTYNFKTVCQNLKFDGCTKFYVDADDEEAKKTKIPKTEVGEKLTVCGEDAKQNFTGPPLRYTEASLVKAMEENGIGRPSTYSPTITTILSREYVEKDGKSFVPTNLGVLVTNLMKNSFSSIVDEKFTAQMEGDLDKIESEGNDWHEVISSFYEDFKTWLSEADENAPKMQETTDEKCEICGENLIVKSGRFGKFLACPKYPDCKFTKPMPKIELTIPCPKCGGVIVEKTSKSRKTFYGCANYPDCDFATWDKPVDKKCEECGSLMIERKFGRAKKIYCSNDKCKNAPPKATKKKVKK